MNENTKVGLAKFAVILAIPILMWLYWLYSDIVAEILLLTVLILVLAALTYSCLRRSSYTRRAKITLSCSIAFLAVGITQVGAYRTIWPMLKAFRNPGEITLPQAATISRYLDHPGSPAGYRYRDGQQISFSPFDLVAARDNALRRKGYAPVMQCWWISGKSGQEDLSTWGVYIPYPHLRS